MVCASCQFSAVVEAGDYPFLAGDGELASLIARYDWSTTALGPIEGWPQSVKTVISLMLRSHVPIVTLWREDGVMIYNDAYAVFAGGRHPELLGSRVREGWPEVAAFNDNVMKVGLAGGTLAFSDQELVLYRNGEPEKIWADLDYSPLLDEAGVPVGVIAIVLETTDKVRARLWLDDERERLRAMFEQAPGFIALLGGPQHEFQFTNPRYQQLIGHRAVIGKTVADALPEAIEQGFVTLLDRAYTTGEAFTGTGAMFTVQPMPGGPSDQRYLNFVYQPIRDPEGRVVGIFVDGVDVTDGIVAERALRESEMRNRQILDSAIDYGIVATDLDGRVTRWNAGAERVLGWNEAEMLGETMAASFAAEDRAAGIATSEMASALSSGFVRSERWHLRKSGERFWANSEMTPLRDEAGTPIGFVKVLRDRTAEHDAEMALLEANDRLRRAQEAGGIGLFTLELAENIIRGTPEFFRVFGVEPVETIPAKAVESLVVAEDAGIVSDSAGRRAGSAPLDVEYHIRRADDGELRLIARKADYERDEAGKPIRLIGVVQDITERRAVQRALAQSEADFSGLAQAMPNQVWTSPPDGQLDWFNEQVYAYSGAERGMLDGDGWIAMVHEEDLPVAAERWAASLESGNNYEIEFRLRDATGAYRWHLTRATPLRDAEGQITRWIGTNIDIHERKLSEAENARDRNRLWSMSQDLLLVTDLGGVITAVNPSATRLLGWSKEDMLGSKISDFLHPDDIAASAAEADKLRGGETTLHFENRYRTSDGDYRLLDWTSVPAGDRIHRVGRDITEQREVEEALRQSQKMEAVGQLTGGIAHDFNNLLQGITGSLDLLQHRVAQGRTGELDRFINGAMMSANRAAALTHRLLAFSRRQPLDPRPVRTNPLVASMEDLLRRTLGEQIDLELVTAGGLWLTRCDPNQLESAILNLAINARDAMPDGGKLTIETCNAHLDSAYAATQSDIAPGQYVCVCVTDTGTGMDQATIKRAFEPFFTTKPIGQGTGLGLSMIYGFTRQSEGYARIYSELGKGTTIKLYLPRYRGTEEEEEAQPALSSVHAADSGETVLVVEDEPVVRGLIVEVLSDLGYRAIEAADGPKGLEILQSKRAIDLMVTDIGLPGLNGRQIADAGRLLRPGLKVLFMTGYAENAALASGFLEHGMSMITKPFAMEVLAARIREIVEG